MNSSERKNRVKEEILRQEVHDQGTKRRLKFQDEREEKEKMGFHGKQEQIIQVHFYRPCKDFHLKIKTT